MDIKEALENIAKQCQIFDEAARLEKIKEEEELKEYLKAKEAQKREEEKKEKDRVANIAEIKKIISDFAGALTPGNMIKIFIKESCCIAVFSSGEHIITDVDKYTRKNKIFSLDKINHYSSVMIIEELRGSYLRIDVRRVDPPVGLTRTEVCCELP